MNNNVSKRDKKLKFNFLDDIMYYDGPLISLGITEHDEPVLQIWIDETEDQKRTVYAYVWLTKENLQDLLYGDKTYYKILSSCEEIMTWEYDGQKSLNFKKIEKKDYLEKYGPKEHVTLTRDMIDVREKYKKYLKGELNQCKNKLY